MHVSNVSVAVVVQHPTRLGVLPKEELQVLGEPMVLALAVLVQVPLAEVEEASGDCLGEVAALQGDRRVGEPLPM